MAENVIGLDLDSDLRDQIIKRQEKLGQRTLTPDVIQYTNANSSWMRIASGADVTADFKERLGITPGIGNGLAKKLVLFGPYASVEDSFSDPTAFDVDTGVNTSDPIFTPAIPSDALSFNNGAWFNTTPAQYGLGEVEKHGYVGPPGIDSIEIQALNRGAIRKANVAITAQSPAQFKLLEALYLRLGFTMLVEWGHTIYFDNDGNLITNPSFSNPAFDSFIKGNKTFLEISQQINQVRKDAYFNYDGFIGYVSNFNWSYRPNGTYSINLSLISRGGLIDSLTINQPALLKTVELRDFEITEKEREELQETNPVASQTLEDVLNDSGEDGTVNLEAIRQYLNPSEAEERLANSDSVIEVFINLIQNHLKDKNSRFGSGKYKGTFSIPFVKKSASSGEPQTQYYVTLGRLLQFISNNCLLYSPKSSTNQIINVDYTAKTSYMLSHPLQASIDPYTCAIPVEIYNKNTKKTKSYPGVFDKLGSPAKQNQYKADIMQIGVNIEFIRKTLNRTDEDGNVSLLKFLELLMEGIRSSTGYINSFIVSYDEINNRITIYDDNFIPGEGGNNNTTIKINYLGFEGSFVNSFSLNTKVFPKIQNLVAIAAQNPDGTSVGEQVASYQKLNGGLKDRIALHSPEGSTINELNVASTTSNEEEDGEEKSSLAYEKKFQVSFDRLSDYLEATWAGGKTLPSREAVSQASSDLVSVLNYEMQRDISDGNISSPFFLPVELSLNMKGISGFKLYEKFDVSPDEILPINYPSNLNYIIQGVSHTVKSNQWTTELKTLSWIAGKNETPKASDRRYKATPQPRPSGGGTGGRVGVRERTGASEPTEQILVKIHRIYEDSTQTLGIFEVYKDESTLLKRYVSSELPWKNNQNRISCIPQGEYKIKSIQNHSKYGPSFVVSGNDQNGFTTSGSTLYDPTSGKTRTEIMIHRGPRAYKWLLGCISPGFKVNVQGNPIQSLKEQGTGGGYVEPSQSESLEAMGEIWASLPKSCRMTIQNGYGMVQQPYSNFADPNLQSLLKEFNLI